MFIQSIDLWSSINGFYETIIGLWFWNPVIGFITDDWWSDARLTTLVIDFIDFKCKKCCCMQHRLNQVAEWNYMAESIGQIWTRRLDHVRDFLCVRLCQVFGSFLMFLSGVRSCFFTNKTVTHQVNHYVGWVQEMNINGLWYSRQRILKSLFACIINSLAPCSLRKCWTFGLFHFLFLQLKCTCFEPIPPGVLWGLTV